MCPQISLLGLPFERLAALVEAAGGAPGHARWLMRRLHAAGPATDALTRPDCPLPRLARERLLASSETQLPRVLEKHASRQDDGTVKLLLEGSAGARFETVVFRNRKGAGRWSLCVSTQAGCRMACAFCATGMAGLTRNLTAAEIVSQYLLARHEVPPGERIGNIVLMGMGEPLDNLEPVLDAISVLHDSAAASIAADRIVVSTAGHVPGLRRLAEFPIAVGLAVSLHAPDDGLRDRLVPLNKRYPLADLLAVLRRHPLRKGKWICFEYVLLRGVNDAREHARALGPLLHGLRAVVQVIPFNAIEGVEFEAPTAAAACSFAERVREGGVPVSLRSSRGPDIAAACGQLTNQRQGVLAAPASSV